MLHTWVSDTKSLYKLFECVFGRYLDFLLKFSFFVFPFKLDPFQLSSRWLQVLYHRADILIALGEATTIINKFLMLDF